MIKIISEGRFVLMHWSGGHFIQDAVEARDACRKIREDAGTKLVGLSIADHGSAPNPDSTTRKAINDRAKETAPFFQEAHIGIRSQDSIMASLQVALFSGLLFLYRMTDGAGQIFAHKSSLDAVRQMPTDPQMYALVEKGLRLNLLTTAEAEAYRTSRASRRSIHAA